MRPVEKHPPVDQFGNVKTYTAHQDARGDLIDQLGDCCSYCGAQLDASLAVEHIQPRNSHPELALQWDNFLLACSNCNSTKGHKPLDLQAYYWPHLDNTHRVFTYGPGGSIRPHPDLKAHQRVIAQQTITLTGLDKKPDPTNDPKRSDRRWTHRLEAWRMAQDEKNALLEYDSSNVRKCIANAASKAGFWSVWVAVFKNDNDMLKRFEEEAFPGTFPAYLHADIRPRTSS